MKEFQKIIRDIKIFRALFQVIFIITLICACVWVNISYALYRGVVSKISFIILTSIFGIFILLTFILASLHKKRIEKLKATYKTNLSFKGDNSTILDLLDSTDKIFLKGPDVDECIAIIIISLNPLPAHVKYRIIGNDKFQSVFSEL